MPKRIVYSIIVLATIVIVGAVIFLLPNNSGISNANSFKAVSPTAPVIIKVNDAGNIRSATQKPMFESLMEISSFKSTTDELEQFFKYFNANKLFNELVFKNDFIVSLNMSGKNDITPLAVISTNSKNKKDIARKIINYISTNSDTPVKSRKYNKATIYEYKKTEQTYFVTEHRSLLLISSKSLLIEESLRLLDADEKSLGGDFEQLLKTSGGQADANIFVNHKTSGLLFEKFVSKNIKYKTSLLKTYGNWTEIDFTVDNNLLMMSGFTTESENDNDNYYAEVFYKQEPTQSRIEKILPASTAYYTSIALSDIPVFFENYSEFLQKRNLFFQRENKLLSIEKRTGIKVNELFQSMISHEAAMAGISIDQNQPQKGKVWIVETKSGSTALKEIHKLRENFYRNEDIATSDLKKTYTIDNETQFNIYRFPYPDVAKTIFGEIFSGFSANWVALYNNHLIFGDSFRTVSKVLYANMLGETLSASLEYNKFKSNMNNRSNLTFYCNTATSLPIAPIFFNNKIASELTNNEELRKFKAFTWQVASTGDMLYNNACLLYNPQIKSKPQTIWQSHLDAPFDFKPKFVINHYDQKNKEVVIHDNSNNFYLINNVGRILWKIKLDGPILGEVYQIDYFRNGKLQYLFNTADKLHLVDREGNYVQNYPINFRDKATCGISVFDYDNNKDYRFFVTCQNRNIYAYEKDGRLVEGWNIFKTDHIVNHSLQHFRTEGKDYIVATDKMKDYILHRRGTVRVSTDAVYHHSPKNTIYLEERTPSHEPRLVTTATDGTLHFTSLETGRHETNEITKVSNDHYFVVANVDNEAEYEYIFADGKKLMIFNKKGKKILDHDFEYPISHKPNIYHFPGSVTKIGITTQASNQIHLINMDGEMHEGFPLNGATEFSIGLISSERSNFNLLVGSPDGYLYNYYVE
ncbi:MAG: hypothetical protein PF486_08260 [Prolixibacteraceae bacterium]|jgi:hypothetical protein|nr:hypothetical protein [Prolixibacteraceae bacterium]